MRLVPALALPVLSLLAALAVARRAAPAPAAGRFDAGGAVLLTALVTALVFVPHRPVLAFVCSVALGALLGLHLGRRLDGFVPAVLFRTPRFLLASGLAFSLAVVNFGILYAAPGRLAEHTGWTAGQTGAVLVWPYLLGGELSWFVVAASARMGFRWVVFALGAAGIAAPVTVALGAQAPALLGAMFLGSIAASSGQGALAVRATAAIPEDERPSGIGMFNLCYLLGGAFGPAIAATLAAG